MPPYMQFWVKYIDTLRVKIAVEMLARRREPRHDHRNCTPRRQLISVCDGVGDQPRIVVSLVVRAPEAVVAAMRDVEEGRHDTALRCLQDRTVSVAAVEGINHSL